MSRIAFFNIPAHGHTNPTLAVVRELCQQGHEVIYYNFEPFRQAIEAAGARFIGCEQFGGGPKNGNGAEVARDMVASTKLIVDTTLAMDEAVTRELEALRPDVIVADSVAFWGKLLAKKLGIPCVISCTTFAFNQYSSKVMKSSLKDLLSMLIKLPRAGALLGPLRAKGYPVKSAMEIVASDPNMPTVVYTSPEFQPASETFSDKYSFVGPCLRPAGVAVEKSGRPLVYISTGTVIRDDGAFFKNCVEALDNGDYDVILSLGEGADAASLGALPECVRAYPRVDQLAVLRSANVFITHCGMNSASEALYYGVPLVTRPLTPEEGGVANRVAELGAGLPLPSDAPEAIRQAVDAALTDPKYRAGAKAISDSFRHCGGAEAAAKAILSAI